MKKMLQKATLLFTNQLFGCIIFKEINAFYQNGENMESHRSEKKQTIFWSAAAVILMVCIFGFSTQSGTESNGLSMKVTKFFAELLFFRFDSMDIGQQTFIITELNFFIRKLAHFTVYTALGMVVYTAVVSSGIKLRHKRLCSLAICALYASVDEIHQYFVSERTMRLKDIFIDSMGSLFGIIIISVIIIVYMYIKQRQCDRQKSE